MPPPVLFRTPPNPKLHEFRARRTPLAQSTSSDAHALRAHNMLHCVFTLSAGFVPTATKHCSAAVPFARSAVGPYATAPDVNADLGVDDVERRFQDMENAKASAPVENAKASAPVEHAKASAPVAALMEKHSFPLGLAQRAVES